MLSSQIKSNEIIFGSCNKDLLEEIIEIKMHIKKITRLSIFEILVGCFTGIWLLFHR